MDSFYITLPSNSSMHIFPDNTVANFKTLLPKRFSLDGDYEVGLTEIHFPQTLCNVFPETHYIIIHSNTKGTPSRKVTIPKGVYHSLEHLIWAINKQAPHGILQYKFDIIGKNYAHFSVPYVDTKIELSPLLALQLGFMPDLDPSRDEQGLAPPSLVLGLPKFLFVYNDLVHPQFVGDVMARLLRVVRVDAKKYHYGGQATEIYLLPQYVPIAKNEFQEVEISIKDALGQDAPFLTGSSTVVLHFRKRK